MDGKNRTVWLVKSHRKREGMTDRDRRRDKKIDRARQTK